MARMVAALFEDRANADRALQTLLEAGLTASQITILGRDRQAASELAPFRETASAPSLAGLDLPRTDAAAFEDGVRRGGVLIAIRVDPAKSDEAIRILEMFDPSDLDRRSREATHDASPGASGVDVGGPLGAGLSAGLSGGGSNVEALPGMGTMADDTSSLGTADLRTTEMSLSDEGRSTRPTGDRRAEERADAPGVLELRRLHTSGRVRSYG